MNIIDYVIKSKNESFLARPFSDADALVFSQIAYYNFNLVSEQFDYSKPSKRYTLFNLLNSDFKDDVLVYRTLMGKNLLKLIKPLKESKRFKDIEIGYVQEILDRREESQFFALTFFLPNDEIFIAFRGTDSTLAGWKEDFNMAHLTTVPSHLKALLYTESVLKFEKNKKFYLGGHSKGGNLAYYVANKIDDKYLDNLIKVYNLDGPGFKHPEEIFNKDKERLLKDRYLKAIPHSSLVGILLNHDSETLIIKSSQFYVLQHDLFSWLLTKDNYNLITLKRRSLISRINEKTMKDYLHSLDDNEKKEIVDALLEMLGGVELSLFDLSIKPLKTIKHFRKVYRSYPKEKRNKLFRAVTLLIKQWGNAVISISVSKTTSLVKRRKNA